MNKLKNYALVGLLTVGAVLNASPEMALQKPQAIDDVKSALTGAAAVIAVKQCAEELAVGNPLPLWLGTWSFNEQILRADFPELNNYFNMITGALIMISSYVNTARGKSVLASVATTALPCVVGGVLGAATCELLNK